MSSLALNRVAKDDFCAKKGHCLKSSACITRRAPVPRQCLIANLYNNQLTPGSLFLFQTLVLTKSALLKFSTGHVIDLISNDVQRLEEEAFKLLFSIVFTFFEVAVVTFWLVYFIGWQSLMGVIFLACLSPYYALLSAAGSKLRLRTAGISDQRLSWMNQVVSGIRAIKTNAWEKEYRDSIKSTRR